MTIIRYIINTKNGVASFLIRYKRGILFVLGYFILGLSLYFAGYGLRYKLYLDSERHEQERVRIKYDPTRRIMLWAKLLMDNDREDGYSLLNVYDASNPNVQEEALPFALVYVNWYGHNYYEFVFRSLLENAAYKCSDGKIKFPFYGVADVDSVTNYIGLMYLITSMRKAKMTAFELLGDMYAVGCIVRKDTALAEYYYDVTWKHQKIRMEDYERLMNLIVQRWPAKKNEMRLMRESLTKEPMAGGWLAWNPFTLFSRYPDYENEQQQHNEDFDNFDGW